MSAVREHICTLIGGLTSSARTRPTEPDLPLVVRSSSPWEGKTMSDDKSNRGPADRSRVNVGEDYEVQYWSEKFGASAVELKAAVGTVGTSAAAVERFLKKR